VKREFKPGNRYKILIIGPLPPPNGGISTVVYNLLHYGISEDFDIYHLDSSSKRSPVKTGTLDFSNVLAFFFQLLSLVFKIIKHRPQIIQIESACYLGFLKNTLFILISKLTFRRIIISIHGSGIRFINFFLNLPPPVRMYVRLILSGCDAIRILSGKWTSMFASVIKLEKDNVLVIPNGINEELFKRKSISRNSFDDEFRLLFLGGIDRKKGIYDLIKVIESLQKKGQRLKLIIVGDERESGTKKDIERIIKKRELDPYVEIVGKVDYKETPSFYHSADAYILPSYSEGLPMVILEAMAAGLPVISTKIGAIPEIIDEGINGFLVDPGDIKGMVSKIEILKKNKGLREIIGRNNITKVMALYSLSQQAKAFKNLYLQLLGNTIRKQHPL
jgi:glycosyltransferase involved in cell wall biosynthesis